MDISARQSAGAHAREQTARAESVDTLPATCHVSPLGGATIEVGFSGIRGVYSRGAIFVPRFFP
jgi:hypothetical protein